MNLLQTGEATLWALFATILVVNARYLLFGATLQPWLWQAGKARAYGSLLLLGDANWMLTMRRVREGEADRAYLAGTGAPITLGWLVGTGLGAAAVSVLPRPEALGFDLMLACFACGMVAALTRRRLDLMPVIAGAGPALAVANLAGPAPAIIAAGLAGAGVAALGAGARR